jgi:hypothetical protein
MLLDNRPVGERVIDVEVTEGDIEAANLAVRPGWRSQNCAVAMALKRSLGGRWVVCHSFAHNHATSMTYSHDGSDIVLGFDLGRPITGRVRLTPMS